MDETKISEKYRIKEKDHTLGDYILAYIFKGYMWIAMGLFIFLIFLIIYLILYPLGVWLFNNGLKGVFSLIGNVFEAIWCGVSNCS